MLRTTVPFFFFINGSLARSLVGMGVAVLLGVAGAGKAGAEGAGGAE